MCTSMTMYATRQSIISFPRNVKQQAAADDLPNVLRFNHVEEVLKLKVNSVSCVAALFTAASSTLLDNMRDDGMFDYDRNLLGARE